MKANSKSVTSYKLQVTSWLGQSLIEVVVAMAVIVGMAMTLVTTTLYTQKTSREARNNTQASQLAQEKIEQIRVYRDRKGYDQLPGNGCYILNTDNPDPDTWVFSPLPNPPSYCSTGPFETKTPDKTAFTKKIILTDDTDLNPLIEYKTAAVVVSWTDSSGTQNVTNTTIFSAGPLGP